MIQTVTGAVEKGDFGRVLMHEHISCSSLSFSKAFGDKWLDNEKIKDLACEALKKAHQEYNLGLMVDGTPIDLGRNASLLREVSFLSGIKIVASTGFYYLQSIEAINNDVNELAKWLINECQNGILGTDIKPGILKGATGEPGITADNRKKLSALGIVQKNTGLPLYIHCEHRGEIAQRQIELLLESDEDIEKIIIGHTALRPDADYLKGILNTGCYICMDQCHCCGHSLNTLAATLVKLCEDGYTNKILISNDYCIHSDFCHKDTDGLHLTAAEHSKRLGYVFEKLYDEYILLGGSKENWETMVCKNPIDILDV